MNKKAFDELIASVKEAGAITRGEKKPARVFAYSAPNVKAIRNKMSSLRNKARRPTHSSAICLSHAGGGVLLP